MPRRDRGRAGPVAAARHLVPRPPDRARRVGEKIKDVVGKVRKPVEKALDFVIDKAISAGQKLLGFAGKGLDWAKKKGKQAKDWGTKKAAQVKDKAAAAATFVGEKLGLIKVQAGFAMADGETHALTVVAAEDGTVEVLMASVMPGRIHPKLQAAIAEVSANWPAQRTVAGTTYKKADVLKRLQEALAAADVAKLKQEWAKINRAKRAAGAAPAGMTRAKNDFRKMSESRLATIVMELGQVPGSRS